MYEEKDILGAYLEQFDVDFYGVKMGMGSKKIANFCIRLLTYLTPVYTPQFFDTTTKPVDTMQRNLATLKSQLEHFKRVSAEIDEVRSRHWPDGQLRAAVFGVGL